ncbi:diguanylate cyclase (GGDEF) domain-containing protein [Ectopseudomonas composti]|uniref:diguanylate cyclase n=1 Tax=Ectopseudomonas composti TaxID=658457 RepID=A0A1I5PDX9_9GAMM|nr:MULTISPECIES: GGDEF domain-containing protein [Pseudomonas]QNH04897.1 GGDEF domain-containing protein [Pseudomonas sp. B11D7D]SFP32308.1 diguanylate cyclase (GGDEF) domain-containing protein [Pseudomonas composti]
MPNYHAWLDEVRPSPYADQLSLGFRWLRFSRGLEREYRAHLLEDSFELKRFALIIATVIWLSLAALDMLVVPASHLGWVLAVRVVVLLILLICAALILQRRHIHLLLPLSMTCILALGVGASLIVGIAHRVEPNYPYEGLLLVSMAAYFLVGLRLSEALACSLVVMLTYVLADLSAGLATPRLINNILFLSFGNLTGAVGCYLLEYKSREHFLISRLMRLLAYHDSLTGLHNRRSFNRQFERLWRQAQRDGKSLALLLCDIDHFKAYNDCYGHQAGDVALQRIGALIEQSARRPLDMGVRLGGEEFALLLFDIGADEARQRAEVLRQSLEEAAIAHRGSDSAAVLTMSIGVAWLSPGSQPDLSQLYEQADRALYEAKAFGRNKVAA